MRTKFLVLTLAVAVAFLLATNPVVAEAARQVKGQITGAQVKNNSLTGKDIKEKSLRRVPKAKDAAKLAGRGPAAYRTTIVYGFGDSTVDLPSGAAPVQVVAPVSLTVPTGVGLVHVIGTGSMGGGGSTGSLWAQVDGVCQIDGDSFGHRAYVDAGADEAPVTFNYVTEVAPGPHTFRLCARNNSDTSIRATTLSVETVAAGSAG